MTEIEERVARQMALERRQLRDEAVVIRRGTRALAAQAGRLRQTVDQAFKALGSGGVACPPELVDDLRQLERLAQELALLNERANTVRLMRASLDEGEFRRRVKRAQQLGVNNGPMTGVAAAEAALVQAGEPMRVEEITRVIVEAGAVDLRGKTPVQTVSGYLAKAAKRGDTFVRVAPATYDLLDRN